MKLDGEALVRRAREAAARAYAPYSQFAVGAALLGESGAIYIGCNVENASYGLTICAERAAVYHAIGQGERRFVAMGLSVPGAGSPCGACRQVLHEFAPNIKLFIGDVAEGPIREVALNALLPDAFGPVDLKTP
jgi:cytidine deaminase